jgi:hypothetical protein
MFLNIARDTIPGKTCHYLKLGHECFSSHTLSSIIHCFQNSQFGVYRVNDPRLNRDKISP